jgi:histidine ammonia-lyase
MSAKGWAPGLTSYQFTYDYAVHGGAVGTIALGNLPDNFIVMKVLAHAETALTGGGSFVVGEDGSGDADGYFTDLDAISVSTVLAGTGALVYSPPTTDAADVGNELPHLVVAAKDGVQVTIGTTAYTAGKIHFVFVGVQAY